MGKVFNGIATSAGGLLLFATGTAVLIRWCSGQRAPNTKVLPPCLGLGFGFDFWLDLGLDRRREFDLDREEEYEDEDEEEEEEEDDRR